MLIAEAVKNDVVILEGEYRIHLEDGKYQLADASASLVLHLCEPYPAHGDVVHAQLMTFRGKDDELEAVGRVSKCSSRTNPLLLVPNAEIPRSQDLIALDAIIQSLDNTLLREFIAQIFQDDELTKAYCQVPCSFKHHHAYPGGLLAHVLEMVRYARDGDFFVKPERYDRELAIIGSIIHDIGKIKTHLLKRDQFMPSNLHEFLGVEIISSPLKWLEQKNKNIACDIKTVLSDLYNRKGTAMTKAGRMLYELDCNSAFVDCYERAFDGKPTSYRYGSLGNGGRGCSYYRCLPARLV